MNFTERLVLLRQEKGLTQVDLSNLVQISRSALSLYELGKREPDFSILSKLALFFGVTTDYLLGITDNPDQANPISDTQNAISPSLSPKDVTNSVIGSRIKEERNKKSLSQEELGKRFSLTQQAINKWESGKSNPDPEMIKQLADFFECSADHLVGRTQLPTTLADPTPQELEEILRSSNVQFEGAPLDETDKEEVLEFLRYIWPKIKNKK